MISFSSEMRSRTTDKCKHLVVLMMENRSFDHMFGFLKNNLWAIDGLDGSENNPDTQGVPVLVSPDARYAGDYTPGPHHDFASISEQIFGNSQGTGNGPFMRGFVKNYYSRTGNVAKSHNIMKCFGPERLPILSSLAKEYAVCDRWFCSVPGPTLPNRAFAFGATSLGRIDMTPNYLALRTIFQLLNEKGVSSKIYYTDWTIGLAVGFLLKNIKKFLFFFDDFIKDCKKNKLPAFSFVEPRYNNFSVRGRFFPAADQHPDHNMLVGERVIKDVYDAITSNKSTWESTLLVITYDEHGGFYDHVKPPKTVNPDDRPPGTTVFDFERLGVRVPAVLVSPFIPRGTIIHNKLFDHTSIIATARRLFISDFANSFLTERDRQANTFEDVLTLASPRTDKVSFPQLASPPSTAPRLIRALPLESTPTDDFQAAMVQQGFIVDSTLPPRKQTRMLVSTIKTEQDTAKYLAAIRDGIKNDRKGGTQGKTSKASRKLVAKKTVKKKR